MNELLYILLILFGLVGSAFYSGLETGIVSINRLRLRHLVRRKVPSADILNEFITQPDHLLGTTLVGNNVCNVLASVSAVSLGTHLMGNTGYSIAYVLLTVIMLVFGEYLPKAWFQGLPAQRCLPFAKLLKWNGYIFYPLSRFFTALAKILVPVRTREDVETAFITIEELKHLTHEGEKTGALSADEKRMITHVLELSGKPCSDIMIPQRQVTKVNVDTPTQRLLELARAKKFSRFPVWDPATKRFMGVVYMYDLLYDEDASGKTARHYMRAPQYVSGATPIDELLPRMRLSHQPMALVRNERDHVIGLITIEDILEEIVGEM